MTLLQGTGNDRQSEQEHAAATRAATEAHVSESNFTDMSFSSACMHFAQITCSRADTCTQPQPAADPCIKVC